MRLVLLAAFLVHRYHRCQGDPDGHVFTHRLLTEGFREDEVSQRVSTEFFTILLWNLFLSLIAAMRSFVFVHLAAEYARV